MHAQFSPLDHHILRATRLGRSLLALSISTVLMACTATSPTAAPLPAGPSAAVTLVTQPLRTPAQPCVNRFVAHPLDFTTRALTHPVGVYESNGTGLAIGDLDSDGRQDLVLADIAGPNVVLWNEGDFRFRREILGDSSVPATSRSAAVVDLNSDGLPDIVFTRQLEKPLVYWNTGTSGAGRFRAELLPGINNPFYAMNFVELSGTDRLAIVAASYDTELAKQAGPAFQQRGGVGVFVYEWHGTEYTGQRLRNSADGLAIALPDLNRDGKPDIWVGNDFNRPDYIWLQGDRTGTDRLWEPGQLPDRITENTMSIDLGDINNDGIPEIFATDMKPYHKDPSTMARWLPMMKLMTKPLTSDDPQYAENTLQMRNDAGVWQNRGYELMIDSSGWSWSGKFGDLDRDGYLDLYVVNGMIAAQLFDHLPNYELVEPNLAFQNTGDGFHPRADWGLGSLSSGRGMSMADLDGDGDLDIVVNNLETPAQVFENRLCGGSSVLVELQHPGSGNTAAIGAQLALHTSAGTFYRDVRASSGYLSGDASQVHFGLPIGTTITQLEIRWPDGAVSIADTIAAQSRITVTRR